MNKLALVTHLAFAGLTAASTPLLAQQQTPARSARAPAAARRATLDWLRLLDQHDFQGAYDSTAKVFQGTTSPLGFANAMRSSRGQYEPFGNRTVRSANFYHDPASATPGDYVNFKFYTTVRNGVVTEFVTTERKADGKWRVDGYLLEPGKR
ncbi:MAG: DUF4019 domain-containing protein [Gemmatimonadales bacterium]